MNDRSRPLTDWLLLAGFCGFLYFFGLASFGLIGADEPRYAQVAREMLARGDWITPTLGGIPWLEKPPLYYWQAIAAYRVFGVSDWSARLPSAFDATLLVIAVYLFLRRFRSGGQLDGALMTASAAGVIAFARAASTDMPLIAFFVMALLAWYAWFESREKPYLILFYFSLALATLAKGPVAVLLAGMVVAVFALARADLKLVWRTLWIPGILLFLAISLPWYVAVQMKNPEFFRVFILEHNLARFSSNLYRHEEPFWYYLPVFLLGLLPWAVFFVAAAFESVRAWWAERREFLQAENALQGFLLIWIAVPLVFFSISRSKLPGYIVPALPAGTLLLAEYLREHIIDNDRPNYILSILHGLVAAAPLVPAMMMQSVIAQHRLPRGRPLAISIAFAAILAIGIIATLQSKAGLRMFRFVTLVPVLLIVTAVLRLGAPSLDATLSARPVAAEISRLGAGPLPLVLWLVPRETEFGLQFYGNQEIVRYETGKLPRGQLLLLAPEAWQKHVAKLAGDRRVSYLGSNAPQGIDYYWVAAQESP
ncbi:MAG TPA: glycosyltransferase family 39 protein [Terriglobales bacterium]|nr:glycosyltransferase family 39 protein [Terriglobales bacterium]